MDLCPTANSLYYQQKPRSLLACILQGCCTLQGGCTNKAPSYPVPAILLCIQWLFSLLLLKCEDSGHFILTLASAKKICIQIQN